MKIIFSTLVDLIKGLFEVLDCFGCDSFLNLNELIPQSLDLELVIMDLSFFPLKFLSMYYLCSFETSNLKNKILSLIFNLLELLFLSLDTLGQ